MVNLFEDRDKPLVVREFFFIIKRLVFAELFKHVVHISDRELRVKGLLTFAVRVKLFAKLANPRLLVFIAYGKWEWIKAADFVITWVITHTKLAAGR